MGKGVGRQFWLAWFALVAGGVAQGDPLPRAREHVESVEAASILAAAERAIAEFPMDLDAHRLRIMALLRLGRRDDAASRRAELAVLFERRMAEIDRMLQGSTSAPPPVVAVPSPSPAPAPNAAPEPQNRSVPPAPAQPDAADHDPEIELDRLIRDSQSKDPVVREAAAGRAKQVLDAAWSSFRSKPGDPARSRRRLEAIGRGSELHPGPGIPILGQMGESGEPDLQKESDRHLGAVMQREAGEAGDALAAGDSDAARRRLEPTRAAAEVLLRTRGPDGRRAVANAMRALSERLERWAAQLEREADAADAQWLARVDAFRAANDELARDPLTVGAAEDGLRALAGSRIESVAASARARLQELARERIAKGRALPSDQAAEAAAQLERAYACDPNQAEAAFDAARLFEGLGDIAAAMAIHKRLANGVSQLAERSRKWWRERLQTARKELAEAPIQVPAVTDERQWPALLDLLRERVPVLAGPELDTIASLVQQRQFAAAEAQVKYRLEQIQVGAVELPTAAVLVGPPQQGDSFVLAALDVSCRFVAGDAGQPGFWALEVPVRSAHWRAAMRDSRIDFRDEAAGYLEASFDNLTRLCTSLTENERAAGRLPANHSYAPPTVAQLERMRDSSGRLPGLSSNRCWTAEEGRGYFEFDLRKLRRVVPVAVRGPVEEVRACAPVVGVGALLVLAPNR